MKGHAVKLKCVNYEFSEKNMNFAKQTNKQTNKTQKTAFLKLENIHNLDTYFHPLRNIVLKLFDDKCTAKACEILRWIDIQEVVFFHAAIVSFLKDKI